MKKIASVVLLAGTALAGCAVDPSAGEGGEEIGQVAQFETSSQRQVAIDAKHAANATLLGAEYAGSLSNYTTPSGGARKRYVNGHIYYGDNVNAAKMVYGVILSKYDQNSNALRGVLGYPITDELPTTNNTGRFNHFEYGSIYYAGNGAFEIHGCHRVVWSRMGWETGRLGFPTSDELSVGSQKISRFQRGNLYFNNGSTSACENASWPVLTSTGGTDATGVPKIYASVAPAYYANEYKVTVSGSNFVPGEVVNFRINTPAQVNHICSGGGAGTTVKADGTFSYTQNEAVIPGCVTYKQHIQKVNGIATFSAVGNKGSVAIFPSTTSYGVAYTGAI
jgi:hypothetical protein